MKLANSVERIGSGAGVCTAMWSFMPRTPLVAQSCSRFTWLPQQAAHGRSNRAGRRQRSEEHTSELQPRLHLVCRLLLEKRNRQAPPPACDPTTTAPCPCRPSPPRATSDSQPFHWGPLPTPAADRVPRSAVYVSQCRTLD